MLIRHVRIRHDVARLGVSMRSWYGGESLMKTPKHAAEIRLRVRAHRGATAGLALLLWFPVLAPPQAAGAEAKEETSAELLVRIREAMTRVRTTYTEFDQERKLDLFDEPLRSEGALIFEQPNRVRWETVKPYQSILVSDGVSVAQFERVDGPWKKLQTGFPRALKTALDQVSAIHRGRVEEMERDFEVAAARRPDGVLLTLVPRSADLRKTLAAIELTLLADLSAAREIRLKEPNGDYTRIAFRNEKRNVPLPEKTFDLAAPVDLKTLQERVHGAAESK
jgi:outer membrane lipoprotein carrier protein